MITFEHRGKTLRFKKPVTIEELGKAMKHYDALIKIFEKRNGLYPEFTDWLIFMKYVEEEKS